MYLTKKCTGVYYECVISIWSVVVDKKEIPLEDWLKILSGQVPEGWTVVKQDGGTECVVRSGNPVRMS